MRAIVFAVSLLSTFATSVHAFVCQTPEGLPDVCLHWVEAEATLRSLLGPSGRPLINGTLNWDQNAFNAANDWNGTGAGFNFTVVFGGESGDPCDCGRGVNDNPVLFASSGCGGGFGDIIAETQSCFERQNGALVNSAVFVSTNARWNAYNGPLMQDANGAINDLRRVLLHEFGHVLGLAHPDAFGQDVTAIMNSHESDLDHLTNDDIAGIFSLYADGSAPIGAGESSPNSCAIQPEGADHGWPFWATVALAAGLATRKRRT